jgi:hypothetical protein
MAHNSGRLARDITSNVVKLIEGNLTGNPRDRYLAEHFMKKFASPDPLEAEIRKDKAIAKWLATEERNAGTNLRLFCIDEEKAIAGLPVMKVLAFAASIIRRLIGSTVPLESLNGSFSGGASTSMRRQPGAVARKFSERPDVTQEAWDYIWPAIYREHDIWHAYNPRVLKPRFVRGNVMFTVPKNNDIDRVACKEPDLNMWLQKGAGDFIRKRLLHVGINLNDQTRNQRLAREGSINGHLATVDLSSASDSISTQLVCLLLPTDWFVFLDRIRCRETRLPDGTWHQNEMFSSMGNGFTFELESLIFYALVKAIARCSRNHDTIAVYGDDIIMASSLFGRVSHIFNFVGFKVNDDKSFAHGPFRESCGKHYISGRDVTPFYIRRPINTVPELIHILNNIRKWASEGSRWAAAGWWDVWQEIADYVPNGKLFGGYDLESIETVASLYGDGWRYMRKFNHRRPKALEVGLYLEWQANARFRQQPNESESTVQFETGSYVVVKPRRNFAFNFGLEPPAFPQEV